MKRTSSLTSPPGKFGVFLCAYNDSFYDLGLPTKNCRVKRALSLTSSSRYVLYYLLNRFLTFFFTDVPFIAS